MNELLSSLLPTAASLLLPGGPVVGMAVKFLADKLGVSDQTQEAVTKALQDTAMTPEGKIKLAQIDVDLKQHMADNGVEIEKLATAEIQAVNQTMQAELNNSKDEAWYQKAWRPANGFSLAIGSFCTVMFTCYLFYKALVLKDMTGLTMLPQLAMSVAAILAIPGAAVGIASWKRGSQKIEDLKSQLKA